MVDVPKVSDRRHLSLQGITFQTPWTMANIAQYPKGSSSTKQIKEGVGRFRNVRRIVETSTESTHWTIVRGLDRRGPLPLGIVC